MQLLVTMRYFYFQYTLEDCLFYLDLRCIFYLAFSRLTCLIVLELLILFVSCLLIFQPFYYCISLLIFPFKYLMNSYNYVEVIFYILTSSWFNLVSLPQSLQLIIKSIWYLLSLPLLIILIFYDLHFGQILFLYWLYSCCNVLYNNDSVLFDNMKTPVVFRYVLT